MGLRRRRGKSKDASRGGSPRFPHPALIGQSLQIARAQSGAASTSAATTATCEAEREPLR